MLIQSVGSLISNKPDFEILPAPSNPQQPSTPQDRVALEKIAKTATKVVLGAVPSITMGTVKGVGNALKTSGEAAIQGLGIDPKSWLGYVLRYVPYVIGGLGLIGGAGPIASMAAALSSPGMIGGAVSVFGGACEGVQDAISLATRAGEKVKEKIEPKYGEKAAKVAKITSSILAGAAAIPIFVVIESIGKGFDFANKAIGIKYPAANLKEAASNLGKSILVTGGFIKGAIGASGLTGTIFAGAESAGGLATTVAGSIGGIKGFADGAKETYQKVSDFVDKHWERSK